MEIGMQERKFCVLDEVFCIFNICWLYIQTEWTRRFSSQEHRMYYKVGTKGPYVAVD